MDMKTCINQCRACEQVCLETLAHCLQQGGKHGEAVLINALLDCIQLCGSCADLMTRFDAKVYAPVDAADALTARPALAAAPTFVAAPRPVFYEPAPPALARGGWRPSRSSRLSDPGYARRPW